MVGVSVTFLVAGVVSMECVCAQPSSLGTMSRGRRWAMFLVVMLETMLWSGTIFGWASLVHVLKLQGVYSNLCLVDQPQDAHTPTPTALNSTSSLVLSYNKVSSAGTLLLLQYRCLSVCVSELQVMHALAHPHTC